MSDGSSKKLGDIRVGDKVVSFDEATGKAAVSEVMAVPVFHRQQEELVELRLPSASMLATEERPRSHRGTQGRALRGSSYRYQSGTDYSHGPAHGDSQMSGAMIAVIVAVIVLMLFGCVCQIMYWKKQQEANAQSEAVRVQAEPQANMVASQGMLPPNLVFAGTYTENGETKTTSYNLTIKDGHVTGRSQDDDGVAQIVGTVNAPQGIIAMWEMRTGVSIKISGNISMTDTGSYQIQASYASSDAGTTGTLSLLTAAMGTVVTETGSPMGQEVQAQVVGNTVVARLMGQEVQAEVVGNTCAGQEVRV